MKLDFYNEFLEEPLLIDGDAVVIPKVPGLGVKLNLDYLKSHVVDG